MTGLYSALVKTAISVPDETFAAVDEAAARLGISRSEFFSRAAERWIDELADEGLTERIDASLEGVDQGRDAELLRAASRRALSDEEW